jgi:hypothetical protein
MTSDNTRLGRLVFPLPPSYMPPGARPAGYVRLFIALLVVASVLLSIRPSAAMAATLRVGPRGCPYAVIQNAIDAARTGDRIMIAPGSYNENLEILSPLPAKMLTLIGSGAPLTIVNGEQLDHVLEVDTDYNVSISGMTFTNGASLPVGGVLNHGTLTLTNVTITHNEGIQTAGGIANDSDGMLTLINSTVNDNTSADQLGGQGGGLFNLGTASLINTTVSGNSAPAQGGGIENRGQLRVTNSRIINNTTQAIGGGLESHSIVGLPTATATLINTSVSNNTAFTGGGLYNDSILTVTSSPISNNSAGEGGGMENSFRGTATIGNSPVSHNTARTDGAGVANDRGKLTLTDSPVNNNQALSTSGAKGGGLAVFGGTVQLNRSPVTHNSARGPIGGLGGGIVITDDGNLTLNGSPVLANSASTGGGGIYVFTGSVSLQISPVQGNQPDNCVNVPDC